MIITTQEKSRSFPKAFYEDTPELQIVKTSDPTGCLLDPMDLLSSKPWAEVNTCSEIKLGREKILILADPGCGNSSRAIQIQKRLQAAKASGFEVYIFQQDELQKWDGKFIPIDYKVDLKQATLENISKLAFKQYQIPAHKIHILGYFETNALIAQDGLMLTDFITDTGDLEEFNEFMTHLAKEPGGPQKVKKIHFHCSLDQSQSVDFLKLREILKVNHFNFLEKIVFSDVKVDSDFFKWLIEFSKILKILDFKNGKNINGFFDAFSKGALSQLENIEFFRADVKTADLKQLWQVAPHLRTLDLTVCRNIGGLFDGLSEGALSQLQEINLLNTDVTVQDLKQLWKVAPNLRKINLKKVSNISGLFGGLLEEALSQLQEINLDLTDVTAQDLRQLWRVAPHLRTLSLAVCRNIGGLFDGLSEGALSQLQKISLDSTGVTAQDLRQLWRVAPHLRILNLVACRNIGGLFDGLSAGALSQLQEIYLSDTEVTVQDLKQLWKVAPNLTKISLGNCKNMGGLFEGLSEGALSQLQKINLLNMDVTIQDLKQLLVIAPNLTKINLFGCKNMGGLFERLSESALSELQEIALSYTDVTAQDLKQLCIAAPHLRTLDLVGCRNIGGLFDGLSEGALSELQEIILSYTDVTAQDLKQLCIVAPNLTKIRLFNCENISGLFEGLSEGALSQLQEIRLDFTDVTIQDLKQLLVVAPNSTDINLNDCPNIPDSCHEINKLINHPLLKLIPIKHIYEKRFSLTQNGRAFRNKKEKVLDFSSKESKEEVLDFSLKESDVALNFVRYFKDVHPSQYRLSIWQPDLNSQDMSQKFESLTDGWEALLPAENPLYTKKKFAVGDNVYSGSMQVDTSLMTRKALQQPFVILPSLDARETIKNLEIVDSEGKIIKDAVKLVYNKKAGFHGVYLPPLIQEHYTIRFDVCASLRDEVPTRMQPFVQFYRSFTPKDLTVPEFPTLKAAAFFYHTHKTGRCELRALAAYAVLLSANKSFSEKNLRIICNDVHAYLEVYHQGSWLKMDLGGSPVILNELQPEIPRKKPKKEEEKQPLEVTVSEIHLDKEDLVKNVGACSLYLIPHISALKTLYTKYVAQYKSENIFVAHEVSNISLRGYSINRSGKILSDGTNLKRFLESHATQECIIVVDMRLMKDEEIPQLNDLLDRKIESYILPENIKISLIDTTKRGYYGPDFRRRVPHHFRVGAVEKPLLLEVPKTVKTRKRKEIGLTEIEINLFDSPFFERLLLGFWQLAKNNEVGDSSTALKLMWKKGELLEAIEKAQGHPMNIIFKNPPLKDLTFQTFMAELETIRHLSGADEPLTLPQNITFYQTQGYDWSSLSENVIIESLRETDVSDEKSELHTLSNSNVLSFIGDSAYFFAKETHELEPQAPHLTAASKRHDKTIRVVCAPGLCKSTLAQFLTEAHKRNINVSFVTPNVKRIPAKSVLHCLEKAKKISTQEVMCAENVKWELHEDVYCGIVGYRENKSFKGLFFNLSSLSASDLGHFPEFSSTDIQTFLQTSTLSFKAPFSDIAQKLKEGETIVLTGDIPPMLYEALTALSLGYIDGERFKGQLIILTTPKEQTLVEDLTGFKLPILNRGTDVAKMRREGIAKELHSGENITTLENISDEERAKAFDTRRLEQVFEGFKKSTWLMIEGKTGIGKSYFMQHLLSEQAMTCDSLEAWFSKTSEDNKPIILIVDEANFNSQLSNKGDNFLERFLGLENNPPGFLWEGKYHRLTPQHKVLFAFNPSTYGQGRKSGGILVEHNVSIEFNPLPDFYLRARVLRPLLKAALKDKADIINQALLLNPIERMYVWLTEHTQDEVFITPREIKAMINLIAVRINASNISDEAIISDLAAQTAYDIARQTIMHNKTVLSEFDSVFPPPRRVVGINLWDSTEQLLSYQQQTCDFIQNMLAVKDQLLSCQNPDLGLGGIILEGPSGIGKTYFINQISTRYQATTNKKVYAISPSTPYTEKVKILEQAFKEGALVVAEEFNTSLWPNKRLNSYLMGVDENGKPSSQPGFMLIGTQNPPYFAHRFEEDPAIRRRIVKVPLDWPKIEVDKHPQSQSRGEPITLAFKRKIEVDTRENNEGPTKRNRSGESLLNIADPELKFAHSV